MLQILKEFKSDYGHTKKSINNDTFITRITKIEKRNKDGSILIKNEKETINLSRKINASAQILKNENAKELFKLITKE